METKKMRRWEVKVLEEKEDVWHCQTFETRREARARAKRLREYERKVKGPMPARDC